MKVVVDSTVFIDYILAKRGVLSRLKEVSAKGVISLYIPSSVIAELWSGESMAIKENESNMRQFLQQVKIIPLTKQLAEQVGELRRKVEIAFVDSVVAVTALYLDAELATSNKKHFEKVKGLRFFES